MEIRILHLIPNLAIGGAQRTVATLQKTQSLVPRVRMFSDLSRTDLDWSDVVVVHSWRSRKDSHELSVPELCQNMHNRPLIIFNHDPEGTYTGHANLVLVCSQYAADRWYGNQPVAILPGGINLDRFQRVASLRTWSKVSVVGRLSTMHAGKISSRVLDYWPQIHADSFLVGGAGSQLKGLLSSCTDQRFCFAGEILPQSTHNFLRSIDIFLYDTETHIESFCYVAVEALAAGCVVVLANRGALGELVSNGKDGFLFSSPSEAVEMCNRLLKNPLVCRETAMKGIASSRRYPAELMQSTFLQYVTKVVMQSRGRCEHANDLLP